MNMISIYFHIITNVGEDDLSSLGDGWGNAGDRLACGVILRVGEVMALLIWYLLELNVCTVKFKKIGNSYNFYII